MLLVTSIRGVRACNRFEGSRPWGGLLGCGCRARVERLAGRFITAFEVGGHHRGEPPTRPAIQPRDRRQMRSRPGSREATVRGAADAVVCIPVAALAAHGAERLHVANPREASLIM